MPINTTLYVHEKTLARIDDACARTGTRRNRMIVLLLTRSLARTATLVRTGAPIRYQDRDSRENWHTVHVRFREDEADYFKDLRNFLKLSASLILAVAASEYLHEIMREYNDKGKCDNYPFVNYLLIRQEIEGLLFWRICWGFPEKPEKYLRL